MLRRLGVRGKILATLAVPIFVLLVAASYISWGAWQEATRAGQTSALVDSLELQDQAGTAVATERALAMLYLNDAGGSSEESEESEGLANQLKEAQEATDEVVDARDEALRALDSDALSVGVQDAIEATLEDRTEIDDVQRLVSTRQITPSQAVGRYTAIVERALDVPRSIAAAEPDAGLAERLNAYVAMDEVMLSNTLERPLIALGLADAAEARARDEDNPDTDASLMQQMMTTLQETDELEANAAEQIERLGGDYVLPGYDPDFQTLRLQLSHVNFSAVDPVVAASSAELSQDWIDQMRPIRDDVRADTVTYAADLATDAQLRAFGTAGAAFGIVLLSLVFALIIARRIVNPLQRLTTATADVRDRLPQMVEQMAVPGQAPSVDLVQIPVESSDEIGRLANAFNEVNATTMEVAREQAALRGSIAEMFVNVARRDQVLLNRQLAFLDELERSEEDPTTLSNLFRLDHLATRMRRNAESLLVLAGIDSGRRVRNPMPVSDVIRTASSEIELYDRIRLELHTDPHMLGHNALNAAHLLAELLENATMFSEPHTPVEVSTSTDNRGVVVTVRDHGLGMSENEIAEANVKVGSTAASDSVGAQRLGLFVVGRLATRLGAAVEFAAGAGGKGTVATVVFPKPLFLADEAMPLPEPTDPLEAATQRSASQFGSGQAAAELSGAAPSTVPAGGPSGTQPAAEPAPVAPAAPPEPEPAPMPEPASFEAEPYRPSVPEPRPATAATPAPRLAEPEPPAAEPVDIDALTDGTTSTGMPRRRRGDSGSPTEAIVLPPLETPSLDTSEPAVEEAAWTPPSEVPASNASLPSRRRSAGPAGEPAPLSGPMPLPAAEEPTSKPIDVEARTGLFSSFRSMDHLEEGAHESTLQLDAVTDDPADVPADFGQVASERPSSPEPASLAGTSTRDADLSTSAPAPAPMATWAPDTAPFSSSASADEPTEPTPEPASAAPAADRGDGVDGTQEMNALPAFEDLMSDLPTRRGESAAPAARKRGLFGRKPAIDEAAAAAAESVTGPASSDVPSATTGRPDRPAPVPDPAPSPLASPGDRAPAVVDPFASDAVPFGAVPAEPAGGRGTLAREPWAADPAPATVREPVVDEVPYRPQTAEPEPMAQRHPAAGARSGDDSSTGASYGDSVLPLRSTAGTGPDPLDPHFVPDTIEARSEWMASAVLYEEMSTLMQRGVFQEENVTSTNEEKTYRPATVAPTAPSGLTRRARAAEPAVPAERFTASIERDPEQLRARLSAFQSATARGRSEANEAGVSTDGPLSVNDVPGSTPQPR